MRVGENSPKWCPTMFSVTNTGLKTLPLWTVKVRPTKSGVMVERRDQVLIGVLDLVSLALTIFSIKWPSTNGPFLIERPMGGNGLVVSWIIGQVHLSFMGRPSRRTRIKRLESFFL